METTTPNPPPVAVSSPNPPMVGQPLLQSAAKKSTEEQRAKWRAKYDARKAKLAGKPLPEKLDVAFAPDPVPAPVGSPPVVPWNPNTLLPLAHEIVAACERGDVESLKDKAKKISPELAAEVAKDAPWNPVAKSSLATSGSAIGAKWLARAGISEENAPEVVFCTAIAAVLAGRGVLVAKLDKILAEQKKIAADKAEENK